MKFSDVKGQEELKSGLRQFYNQNRLSHALMLCEKAGYGALPLVLAFIQYMCCKNRTEEDSCGVCPSCGKISKMIHADLHFAVPVNSTKKIPSDKKPVTDHFIDKWRESVIKNPYLSEEEWYSEIEIEEKSGNISVSEAAAITKKLSLRSYEGGDKFMVIWLPENMNREASNKLLKLLEEPPAGTYFFLISQSPESIISTITSRCQMIFMKPESTEVLSSILKQEFSLNHDDSLTWCRISGGSYGQAVRLIKGSQADTAFFEYTDKLLEYSFNKNLTELIKHWEEIASIGRERQKQLCVYALEMLRKIYVTKLGKTEISNATSTEKERINYWAGRLPEEFYEKAYLNLNKCISDLERNVNSKLVFSDLSNRFFISLQNYGSTK